MTDNSKLIVSEASLPHIRLAVLSGLDVASGARATATHYHSREEQISAVQDAVGKIYTVAKEIPLIIGAQDGTTGFFIQEALLNEFQQSTKRGHNRIVAPNWWDDEGLSERAIRACVANLHKNAGIPYVLRMFVQLKERKINNARSRRVVLEYVFGLPNLEFAAVKYRDKLRTILTHVWGEKNASVLCNIAQNALGGVTDSKSTAIENDLFTKYTTHPTEYLEKILLYIFGRGTEDMYVAPDELEYSPFTVIPQVFKAHTDFKGCDLVPEEVLTGILSDPNHPQHAEHWSDDEQKALTVEAIRKANVVETANQAVRKTKQEKKKGIERTVDVGKVTDPIALLKTGYEDGFTSEINNQLDELAEKAKYKNFPYSHIGLIKDNSPSMRGHFEESKNTPRAVVDFMDNVLTKSVDKVSGYHSANLSRGFLRVVGDENVEAVFILSDGYENDYDGLLSEVVDAWRDLEGKQIPVYHVSPIGAAEVNAKARPLGEGIVTMTATHKTLPVQMQSNLVEADTRMWLEQQVARLEAGA